MYCGAINPQAPEIVCERPGEGARSNHPEHTGKSGSGFLDWPNEAYRQIERRISFKRDGKSNPPKYKVTIHEMAERTKGGNNES